MNRPTSLTIFGILNIVFAAFGILGVFAAAAMFYMPQPANTPNPVLQLIHDNPTYATWMMVSACLGAVGSVVLLMSGIGLLKIRPWARILSIIYALYTIIMVMIGTAVNYQFLVKPLLAQAHQQQGPAAAAATGGAIGGTIGGCFGLIYPIVLLVFMLMPKSAAYFRPPPLP